ncbi:MAG: hypothetical protein IK118_08060, partial [Clostridia bacterium]|nr:hypothetical protein [Clostridia bacterium]
RGKRYNKKTSRTGGLLLDYESLFSRKNLRKKATRGFVQRSMRRQPASPQAVTTNLKSCPRAAFLPTLFTINYQLSTINKQLFTHKKNSRGTLATEQASFIFSTISMIACVLNNELIIAFSQKSVIIELHR